jgi:hypothetical protein
LSIKFIYEMKKANSFNNQCIFFVTKKLHSQLAQRYVLYVSKCLAHSTFHHNHITCPRQMTLLIFILIKHQFIKLSSIFCKCLGVRHK